MFMKRNPFENKLRPLVAAVAVLTLCVLPVAAETEPAAPADEEEPDARARIELAAAVAKVNEELQKYFTEVDSRRDEPLPKEKRPAPLTVDEVLAAIRQWKPKDSRIAQAALPIFQGIAESKVLPPPPRARLYHHDQWFDNDRDDRYEYRIFRYQLDVMTSETTGHGLAIRIGPIDRRIAMRASEGYTWLLRPRELELRPRTAAWTGDFACSIVEGKEGSLIAFTTHLLKDAGDYHIKGVAFDAEFQRHELTGSRLGKIGNAGMTRFDVPPADEPWQRFKYLGFEVVAGSDGVRIISQRAIESAKAKGIDILPLPEQGSRYEMSLTTVNGKVVDTHSLKGKVLLIDFWATWCGPCMKNMPELKRLYEQWHDRGLEVLGVSYDEDAEAAQAAYERFDIPWDLFVIPGGEVNRELWRDATTIETLPTVLLIDEEGTLHATLVGEQIDEKLSQTIQKLLATEPERP